MHIVRGMGDFKQVKDDGCISDVLTAEEYAARVFHPDILPAEMSTKSFVRMAMDLLDENDLFEQLTVAIQN